jgi:hypothetical protein
VGILYAFDLIELGGDDLRREPREVRKATLASVLAKAGPGIRFNEHLDFDDGEAVFRHACKMGLDPCRPRITLTAADYLPCPRCEAYFLATTSP